MTEKSNFRSKYLMAAALAAGLALGYPVKASDSYTLEQVSEAGENTITKYDAETGEFKYYKVILKTTTYGSSSNPVDINNVNGVNGGTYDIEAYYGDNASSEHLATNSNTGNITTDYVNAYIQGGFVQGGAIFNNEDISIEKIEANFIGNYTTTSNNNAYGGAIYNNNGTITSIAGFFIGNYADGTNFNAGGAIYNEVGTITSITGDFVGNYAGDVNSITSSYGGAIYNYGTIGTITSNFIGNYVVSNGGSDYGGAIRNDIEIGSITGDFIGNYAGDVSSSADSQGGAIWNKGELTYVTGDFIGNYADSSGTAYGGAIYNSGTMTSISGKFYSNSTSTNTGFAVGGAIFNDDNSSIGSITGDFTGNSATSANSYVYGGAISNNGEIDTITADFAGNFVDTKSGYSYGGAIHNNGTIGSINGNFSYNSATSEGEATEDNSHGGAIYNYGTIGSITGDFTNNFVRSTHEATGGAIHNQEAEIDSITGSFINNYIVSGSENAYGGAIYNYGTIGSITGDFIGNYATSSSEDKHAYGGAIYNKEAEITTINGNFTGNYADSNNFDSGGAIYNENSTITSITGDFTGNYAGHTESTSNSQGGAIFNDGGSSIGSITGNFTGNYAVSNSIDSGGAIVNDGTVGSITGNFTGNYAGDANCDGNSHGGAIYNYGTIGSITGNFTNNFVGSTEEATGGAIHNQGAEIDSITGSFINNYIVSGTDNAMGGAIYNSGTMTSISGDFIGNYATSSDKNAYGGAIYNINAVTGSITGNFVGNRADSATFNAGGAIYNENSIITSITGDFSGNYAGHTDSISNSQGGAIWNNGEITSVTGDFTGNYAVSNSYDYGGAIHNDGTIASITGNFTGNYAGDANCDGNSHGGAIYNNGTIISITGDFIGNYAGSTEEATGGAIHNQGVEIDSITGSFINNYAQSTSGEAKGGAIYTTTDLNFVSDNYTMVFSGNYTDSAGTIDDNAIYVDSSDAVVTFTLSNGGKVVMKDNIRGLDGYSVKIEGGSKDNTTFYMLNEMYDANLSVGNTTLNTINNDIHTYDVKSFTLTGDTNIAVDVDLKNEQMDRITADEYGAHEGNLNISGINLTSDTTAKSVDILFAEAGLKNNVTLTDSSIPGGTQTTAYTPIYKYGVSYANRNDAGYLTFNRNGYNPAVLASPVAAQTGAYTAMLNTFDTSFEHSDYFMKLPSTTRLTLRDQNKYAITDTNNLVYKPNELTNDGIWLRPYTSFESIALRNGPKVNTITYGSLFGFDTEFKELRNGWGTVFTGYLGYNGSAQDYSNVDIYQNGGVLGGTQTFYKNNFFTALTATAGASVGDANTMYGHENFTMLMAGVASKTGYSLEFKEGKFIILPTFLMSYSFIDTFNYKNAAGVSIKSDPLHAIQLNPNIRFIANTEKNWQPYATVGMVWNILDKTRVSANDLSLPQMSLKPYIEYGLGIQRHWNERFAGYGQALVRNGGRNGIVITFGFRWAFGKDKKPSLVSAPDKKVIKQ